MAVKQHCLGSVAWHLDQQQRRAAGQADDVQGRAGQARQPGARPALKQRDGLFHMAVRRPVRIEGRRFVRDPDVIDEGRDNRVAPALVGKAGELWHIEHAASLLRRGHAITACQPGRRRLPMILVFGSINVDVLVPVPALPRPGETVLGGDYALAPGGKGANQAVAARRAGAAVAVGEDAFAALTLETLRGDGVELAPVRRVARPTGCAAIMIGGDGENLIAVAPGANLEVRAAAVPQAMLGSATTLVCQMEAPPAETWALLRRARAAGARTILNLAPAAPLDPAAWADLDVLVANRGEAAALGGEPAALAPRLRQALIVTHGAAGSTAWLADGGRIDTPALAIQPVDTTGAGDTFVGVLAAALDGGGPLCSALRRASAAASLACLARGAQTAMPRADQIDAALAALRH
jgi:ribokinase